MSAVEASATPTGASVTSVASASLEPELRDGLVALLYAVGDDELLLGHRDAEWTGLGPILEEDIAFSSMAQDEMGHALVWYGILQELGEPEPDRIAYGRSAEGFKNAQLFELPRGDYAFSLARQYLADLAEAVRYDALKGSAFAPVAQAATKLRQEEKYHLLHGRTLVRHLAHGTRESRDRLQSALDEVFPYALGIWEATPLEADLAAAGITTASEALAQTWLDATAGFLTDLGLTVAAEPSDGGWQATKDPMLGGRAGQHGPGLDEILDAMQRLHQLEPGAEW
jgi:ring-1,2-phenylacetyl-CoA epoxidase subunit PaaC